MLVHKFLNNKSHCAWSSIKHNFLKSDIHFNPIFIPCFLGSKFLRVQVFQGPVFSSSRFFRIQVFLGRGFSESGSRVLVQVLEIAFQHVYVVFSVFFNYSNIKPYVLLFNNNFFIKSFLENKKRKLLLKKHDAEYGFKYSVFKVIVYTRVPWMCYGEKCHAFLKRTLLEKGALLF